MKQLFILVLLLLPLLAQETVTRIPVSRKDTSALAALFDELPQRIEVFMTADSIFVVEAIYEDKKMTREYNAAEYRELLAQPPRRIVTLENARVPYLIGQTALGIGLYSWAVPVALGLEDKGAIVVGLFTPLAYATAQFLLTRGVRLSDGAAYGAFLGGSQGAVHGGLLFKSWRGVLPMSLAENLLDLALAQRLGFTPAMYERKSNYCLIGYYHYAAMRTLIVDWNEHEVDDFLQLGTVSSMAEGYAALFLSKNAEELTHGDALFELRTAVIGAELFPFLLATLDLHRDEQSDERIYAAISLVGHGLGYLLGKQLTREYDLSASSGALTWLIPYLAHGATAGVVVLTESEGLARSYPAIFLAVDVALTYVCYRAFARKARHVGMTDHPRINFAVNPAFFALRERGTGSVPIASVVYHF